MLGITIERYDVTGKEPDLLEALSVTFTTDAEETQQRVYANVTGGMLNEYTGDLADSVIAKQAAVSGAEVKSSVQAGGGQAWYANLLEKGVPHPWEEDTKRGTQGKGGGRGVLAFESVGETFFRRMVEHPAAPPRPFFSSVVETMTPKIEEDTRRAVETVLNEQSRTKELYS